MGYKLLPMHREDPNNGWTEFHSPSVEFLNQLNIGTFDLGNYGKQFNPAAKDKHAAHYSIPNPWAAAYLIHNVLKEGRHNLLEPMLQSLLNLLNDYFNYRTIKCIKVVQPDNKTPFHLFWNLAPDFLKFTEGMSKVMYFLTDMQGKIVGGLSRTTLVWAAQSYIPSMELSPLNDEVPLHSFLRMIKEKGYPEEIAGAERARFWGHAILRDMISDAPDIATTEDAACSVDWMRIKSAQSITGSNYKIGDRFIFDIDSLNETMILGNQHVPPGFAEKLRQLKRGKTLPMQQGDHEWALFSELFEKTWIQMKEMEDYEDTDAFYGEWCLYPVTPDYLRWGFNLDNIRRNEFQFVSDNKRAASEFQITINGTQFTHRPAQEVETDDRTIAIWPPFPSRIIPTFIMENEKGDSPELEFYSKKGEQLTATVIREDDTSRVYKLKDVGSFPDYIRLQNSKGSGGLLKTKGAALPEKKNEVTVGFDFGSTHTTVAYSNGNGRPEPMVFNNSRPIIICSAHNRYREVTKFVPAEVVVKPKLEFEDWKVFEKSWVPFRSIWNQFPNGDSNFLTGGHPAFTSSDELIHTSDFEFEQDIKWSSNSEARNGFLKYLMTLIIVECEGLGANKINIRWSYPKAFSTIEKQTMAKFYSTLSKQFTSDQYEIDVQKSTSEALCTVEYFLHEHDGFATPGRICTMDIGGGTTDYTFLEDGKVAWEDSVKFGGEIIEKNKIKHIIEMMNSVRRKRELAEINPSARFCDYIRLWPGVEESWDGKLPDFISAKQSRQNFFQILSLFYSGLFFYLGLHLRRKKITEPLKKIACAGGGIQFLFIASQGNELTSEFVPEWLNLFRSMIAAGQGIEKTDYSNCQIYFTSDPKMEVAYGLLQNPEKYEAVAPVEKMIGLDVIMDSKVIPWDAKLPEYDESSSMAMAEIDYSLLTEFMNHYNSLVSDPEAKDVFSGLGQEVDDIKQQIHDHVSQELAKRNKLPIAAPLFFTALRTWMLNGNGAFNGK